MLIKRLGEVNLEDFDYKFKYSNFGIATVGMVLEKIYGNDYTALMNDYISDDLGLANTRISDGTGDLKNSWEWSESDSYIPAGAILSNIDIVKSFARL